MSLQCLQAVLNHPLSDPLTAVRSCDRKMVQIPTPVITTTKHCTNQCHIFAGYKTGSGVASQIA